MKDTQLFRVKNERGEQSNNTSLHHNGEKRVDLTLSLVGAH